MKSKIAEHVKLNASPVAVVQSDTCPEKVLRFKPGQRGCVIASKFDCCKCTTRCVKILPTLN